MDMRRVSQLGQLLEDCLEANGVSPQNTSLPECLDFKLFGKIILLGVSQPSGFLLFSLLVCGGSFHLTHYHLVTFRGGSENGQPRVVNNEFGFGQPTQEGR